MTSPNAESARDAQRPPDGMLQFRPAYDSTA